MSRAETLAGLTEAIAGHRASLVVQCTCGQWKPSSLTLTMQQFRAEHERHVAAVALAWLEGHDWRHCPPIAEGLRGYLDDDGYMQYVHLPRIPHSTRTLRGVMAPVETGEDA